MHSLYAMRTEIASHLRDAEVARVASRQFGLITRRQLDGIGLTSPAVALRVRCGRLHRIRRGVYAVGHTVLSRDARRLAAVLTFGDGAVLAHASAAGLHDLRPDNGTLVHVAVPPGRRCRPRPGICVHHAGDLTPADCTTRRGIPVTTLARTLADLGESVPANHVRAAFIRAEQLRVLDMREIDAALARAHRRRRGPAILRELLRGYDPRWQETLSGLELRLLDIVAAHDLPAPDVNAWIDGRFLVDVLWRRERLAVETDSARFHDTPHARRSDARRDRELRRLGLTVLRVTDAELGGRPDTVAARLTRALRAAATSAPGASRGRAPSRG